MGSTALTRSRRRLQSVLRIYPWSVKAGKNGKAEGRSADGARLRGSGTVTVSTHHLVAGRTEARTGGRAAALSPMGDRIPDPMADAMTEPMAQAMTDTPATCLAKDAESWNP
jgi:hypothetical protein